jgi:hypothetical protein
MSEKIDNYQKLMRNNNLTKTLDIKKGSMNIGNINSATYQSETNINDSLEFKVKFEDVNKASDTFRN